MDTWDRPCVRCSVDLPNGGSWINGRGPLCSACSINTMRLLNGGQARFEVSEIIALRAELATLRAEAARLREALEAIKGINYSAGYLPPHEPNAAKAIDIARHALDSTPTTAEWLAARDEEMKRLGAAEWLEKTSAENLERFGTHFYESTTDSMLTEAARLRKGVENGR